MADEIIELPNEIICMIMEQLYRLNKSIVLNDLRSSTRNINYNLNFSTNTENFKYIRADNFWIMTRPKIYNNCAISYYKFPSIYADFD